MTQADATLLAAIEQSYVAFAAFPLPRALTASPLRDAKAILATLSAAPLRELTGEQVGPYSGWAMTTVGNDRDYRHFLPRIFELAATDPVWLGTEPPVMASRLNMAGWRDWPEDQRDAVLTFFRSAFRASIEQHPDEAVQTASIWLCGLSVLRDSPSLAFERWRGSSSPNAALQLGAFVNDEGKHLRRHSDVQGPFWDEVDVLLRHDVAERLVSEETRAFLQAAAINATEQDRFYFLDAALSEFDRRD